ncbi:MAG TPA: ABC transporter substrate-binding protein [Candidatus Aphodomorpha intestinavium]|uniref:ABC transporter substrate-binding protein n=1 Tax=Candidatus Aphodomorpha intestinavium TaxID=2840672 RepID=A0A9D1N3X9_9FIRM|nr:ABC transporter substrate-binding protein [Candidatus Aphodomorpha intestinavium]
MKHLNRTLAALLAALLLALTACAPAAAPEATQAPEATEAPAATDAPEAAGVTVTDMAGREITLDAPATRVVALSASDCEIIYALGAGELLVGRGEYCDYPAEVLEVPAVQSGAETNIEQIIALEPQVLFMTKMAQTEEQIAALEAAGVHVVVSDAQDIAGVYEAIGMIGTLLGREAEAGTMVADMVAAFDDVAARAAGDGSETIYFEVSPLQYGLWAAGADTFMDEIAQMLGLTNAFADVSGWAEVSEEQVLSRDPDYIVTISMYYGEGPTPVEEIQGRAGWENVSAVKNGKILNLQNNELSRPSYRLAEGARMLCDFVYGAADAQ